MTSVGSRAFAECSVPSVDIVRDYQPYARNGLAILVPAANPAGVRGPEDLGRPGGSWRRRPRAARPISPTIHHRETIGLLRGGLMDAGPVWLSEALHQRKKRRLPGLVEIPPEHDVIGGYFIARVDKAGRRSLLP